MQGDTTAALPEPLVAADVDCKDLDGFMLNVERLMASELVALSTHEVVGAALFVWCRAWKQTPAASLPNDERVLAAFSRLPLPRFRKLRGEIMRGFVLCSDGRLYHRVLGEEATRAHAKKIAFQGKRNADAERLAKWRASKSETRNETHIETPDETRFKDATTGVSSRKDRDSTGTGTGQGRNLSQKLSEADASSPGEAGLFGAGELPDGLGGDGTDAAGDDEPEAGALNGHRHTASLPSCPHREIIAAYREELPTLPDVRDEMWRGKRARTLQARWRWLLRAKSAKSGERYATDATTGVDWFRRYFRWAAGSKFLTEDCNACDLAWLLNEENMTKVIQGNYHTDRKPR